MDNIKQLLELNIEIEGLLRVIDARSSEAAESLLLAKSKQFVDILNSSIQVPEPKVDLSDTPSDTASVKEVHSSESETVNEIRNNAYVTDTSVNVIDDVVTPAPSEEMETVLEMDDEIQDTDIDTTPAIAMPPVFNPANPQKQTEKISSNLNNPETGSTAIKIPVQDDHVMRIDEMIQRQTSRDLKKAFSLNDRFKYIREIFDNDANYFDETLKNLEMLSNLDDVYDYLLGDIGLNHEDQTVKEFLAIIYNHFKV